MREQVRDGLSNRLRGASKHESGGERDISPDLSVYKSDVEVGSFQEVMDIEQSGQKGTKRSSTSGIERNEVQSEDGRNIHSCGVGGSVQPTSDCAQPKSAKRSRRWERDMSYREEGNSAAVHSEEVSGGAENSTFNVKGGQKATERSARARKEAESKANIGYRSRSAKPTGGCAQLESGNTWRTLTHVEDEEVFEEEGPDEDYSEAGNSDRAMPGDPSCGKDVEPLTKNRLSKRKSDEIDHGVEKNVRRRGSGCEFHTLAYFSLNF